MTPEEEIYVNKIDMRTLRVGDVFKMYIREPDCFLVLEVNPLAYSQVQIKYLDIHRKKTRLMRTQLKYLEEVYLMSRIDI